MQHFIGHRTFAPLDSRATEAQERQREQALKLEFIALVPAAGRLRACELVLQRHHTDEGCKLEYHLAYLPQTSFEFEATGEPRPAGAKESAEFQSDVAAVSAECKNVRTRLVMARSPGLGNGELQQDDPATLDIKSLRRLFRRRAREVILPTPEGDLILEIPAVAPRLPTGIEGEITAQVTSLSSGKKASLRNLAWKPSTTEREHQSTLLPASALARRGELSEAAAVRLLNGMDAGETMIFRVQFDFDWATGAAVEVKLLDVGTD